LSQNVCFFSAQIWRMSMQLDAKICWLEQSEIRYSLTLSAKHV
jgi:hypothetical protein